MKTNMISKIGLGFVVSILMLSGIVAAQGFQDVINSFKDIGVFQFYLPFILAFAIIYGLLVKIGVFGDKGRAIAVIVALSISAFIMITPAGVSFSDFLAKFITNSVIVIIATLVVLMFAAITASGFNFKWEDVIKGGALWAVLLFILLIVFGIFVSSGGTSVFPGLRIGSGNPFSVGGISNGTLALIILIAGTGLIVFFFIRGGGGGGTAGGPGHP